MKCSVIQMLFNNQPPYLFPRSQTWSFFIFFKQGKYLVSLVQSVQVREGICLTLFFNQLTESVGQRAREGQHCVTLASLKLLKTQNTFAGIPLKMFFFFVQIFIIVFFLSFLLKRFKLWCALTLVNFPSLMTIVCVASFSLVT